MRAGLTGRMANPRRPRDRRPICDADTPVETIVVGYDGSDEARTALERAGDFARAFDATVLVVAVAEAAVTPELPPTDEFLDAAPIDLEPIETAEVERELDEAVERLSTNGIRSERVWVVVYPAPSRFSMSPQTAGPTSWSWAPEIRASCLASSEPPSATTSSATPASDVLVVHCSRRSGRGAVRRGSYACHRVTTVLPVLALLAVVAAVLVAAERGLFKGRAIVPLAVVVSVAKQPCSPGRSTRAASSSRRRFCFRSSAGSCCRR